MGASGFVGRNLIPKLISDADFQVVGLCRNPETKDLNFSNTNFTTHNCDVFNLDDLRFGLEKADLAYYFIHLMGEKGDFYERESQAAENFGRICEEKGAKNVIYLSGLGDTTGNLSKHLLSRHRTGEILSKYIPNVLEFRASIIVGKGSVSFEIVRDLVNKLSFLPLPKSILTQTQPITLADIISYLIAGLKLKFYGHEIVEVGGPEIMMYKDLIDRYAKWLGKRIYLSRMRFVPAKIMAKGFNLIVSKRHASIGSHLVESLKNPMIVRDTKAEVLFPDITMHQIESEFY